MLRSDAFLWPDTENRHDQHISFHALKAMSSIDLSLHPLLIVNLSLTQLFFTPTFPKVPS